ncbi:MAG: hypothetical protein U0169_04860 [Polyangiaceae bacterium]
MGPRFLMDPTPGILIAAPMARLAYVDQGPPDARYATFLSSERPGIVDMNGLGTTGLGPFETSDAQILASPRCLFWIGAAQSPTPQVKGLPVPARP